MLVSWFCTFCTSWQNCWLCEMPAITPAASPTGAQRAGSELTPAQLLDEMVSSVFCSAVQMSLRLQLLPPALALESGNSIAAASHAALIVSAMRRPVAMGQPCQLQGLRYRPVPAERYTQSESTYNVRDRI